MISNNAYALPHYADAPAGNVVVNASSTVMDITQSSDRAIIEWHDFNITEGETVRFQQPDVTSVTLNRVTGNNGATTIDGALQSNGQLLVLNPNGIVFGASANIDVGGLVASSSRVNNDAFMAGQLSLTPSANHNATIHNAGTITARDGGLVALVAPHVRNQGAISARAGQVALAAGDIATIDLYGDGLLSLAAGSSLQHSQVTHDGTIQADGGVVILDAAHAATLVDGVVNMHGIVQANSLSHDVGAVIIGEHAQRTVIAGNISTESTRSRGGEVQISGRNITLTHSATIAANGAEGGGSVTVGGAALGQGDLPQAHKVTIDNSSLIQAMATRSGSGGDIVIWSDARTDFHGDIRATGIDGGGHVETSSKGQLHLSGSVDASAKAGSAGRWLLDPTNVVIANGAGTDVSGCGGSCDGIATVDANSISAALGAGNDVIITTDSPNGDDGNISASNVTINNNSGGERSLTLKANNYIDLDASTISASGSGNALNIILHADATTINTTSNNAGHIELDNVTLSSNGGDIVLGGGADPRMNFAWGSADTNSERHGVTLQNNTMISSGAGDVILNGHGFNGGTVSNITGISIDSSSIRAESGDITIDGVGGDGTLNDNYGVSLVGSSITSTGVNADAANITITGQGGQGLNRNYGIYLQGASTILDTDNGAITLHGTGGANVNGVSNHGIVIADSATVTSSSNRAVNGDITIEGYGGTGAGSDSYGVNVNGGRVISTAIGDDAAALLIEGTGGVVSRYGRGVVIKSAASRVSSRDGRIEITGMGADAGDQNHGVEVNSDAVIQSEKGDIDIHGTAGVGTGRNYGVFINDSAIVRTIDTSEDAGNIDIYGKGQSDGTGGNNHGVYILAAVNTDQGDITIDGIAEDGTSNNDGFRLEQGIISSTDGTIIVRGKGQLSGASDDILLYNTAKILSDGQSDITLEALGGSNTEIRFTGGVNNIGGADAQGNITVIADNYQAASDRVETAGNITFMPRTPSAVIGLGGAGGNLDINDTRLGGIRAGGVLTFGRADGTGAINVHNYTGWDSDVTLLSDSGVITMVQMNDFADHDVTLQTNADIAVSSQQSGTGALRVYTGQPASTIGLAGEAGDVNITSSELDFLGANWSSMSFGNDAMSAALRVGAYEWAAPIILDTGSGGIITVAGEQTASAASDASFVMNGPSHLAANIDMRASGAVGNAITFSSPVTLLSDVALHASGGSITTAAIDGAHALNIHTNNALSLGEIGSVTPVGAITISGASSVSASSSIHAAQLTQTGVTGDTDYDSLTTTGDIAIETNGALRGRFNGANGTLTSLGNAVNATVTFDTLDIGVQSTSAQLLAGRIGMGSINQAMANKITIGGMAAPLLTPSASYRFASFIIGDDIRTENVNEVTSEPPTIIPPLDVMQDTVITDMTPAPTEPTSTETDMSQTTQRLADILRSEIMQTDDTQYYTTPYINNIKAYGRELFTLSKPLLQDVGCGSTSSDKSCEGLSNR